MHVPGIQYDLDLVTLTFGYVVFARSICLLVIGHPVPSFRETWVTLTFDL